MHTLQIKDESTSGEILNELLLQFESEYITVEQLIKARIDAEIKRYEKDAEGYRKGLVQSGHLEKRLNKPNKQIDAEKQLYVALKSFKENGFFILVDDEQVDELQQKFFVDESTVVSFIKLTPLIGG